MYGFVDKTYNPIKGACSHSCIYCYMEPMRRRFHQDAKLRLSSEELAKGLGTGKTIFVGSSTDGFAADVPSEWIIKELDHLQASPGNTYLLQSKNPARFLDFMSHPLFGGKNRVIFCTTLECDIDHSGISKAPVIRERVRAIQELSNRGFQIMVTVEPIMAFSSAANFAAMIASCNPIQVNLGANTNRGVKLPEPSKADVATLVGELRQRGLNVHFKNNIGRMID